MANTVAQSALMKLAAVVAQESIDRARAKHPATMTHQSGDGYKVIFRTWKYDGAGHKLWARDFGLRAWRLYSYAH